MGIYEFIYFLIFVTAVITAALPGRWFDSHLVSVFVKLHARRPEIGIEPKPRCKMTVITTKPLSTY